MFQSKKGQNGVDDMVMLPKIDESSLVDNLKKRYDSDAIYTNIGPVLLSVNPYKDLGIWGQDYILLYQGKQRHENPPHIYALAEETYRMMRSERENQCCKCSTIHLFFSFAWRFFFRLLGVFFFFFHTPLLCRYHFWRVWCR